MKEEFIVPIISVFYFIALWALMIFNHKVNKKLQNLILEQQEQIIALNEKDNSVLKYCLKRILLDSLKEEDYETAQHCKQLIESLK